ncbi:MAG: hypothetical protein ACK463_30465, partial [Bradyrhizobium sp.]
APLAMTRRVGWVERSDTHHLAALSRTNSVRRWWRSPRRRSASGLIRPHADRRLGLRHQRLTEFVLLSAAR